MTAAEKIKRWMDANHLTQVAAAARAKIAQSRLNDVLHGKRLSATIGFPLAREMAKDYPGVTLDYLLNPEAAWPPPPLPSPGSGVQLTDEEAELLTVARAIGLPRAKARMLNLPDPEPGRLRESATRDVTPDAADEPRGRVGRPAKRSQG